MDMTRIVLHILIPLNLIIALCLAGGGVIQNLKPAETVLCWSRLPSAPAEKFWRAPRST